MERKLQREAGTLEEDNLEVLDGPRDPYADEAVPARASIARGATSGDAWVLVMLANLAGLLVARQHGVKL